MIIETVETLAREGVRGASFSERIEVVTACLHKLVPSSLAAAAIVNHENIPIGAHAWAPGAEVGWKEYAECYRVYDPTPKACFARPGKAVSLAQFIPDRSWGSDPYSGEFMARNKVRHSGRCITPIPYQGCSLAFASGRDRGEITRWDLAVIERVAAALAEGWAAETARHSLTPMESAVADLAALGHGVKAIASVLAVSESTVKTHLHTVYRKLRVSTRAELARRF